MRGRGGIGLGNGGWGREGSRSGMEGTGWEGPTSHEGERGMDGQTQDQFRFRTLRSSNVYQIDFEHIQPTPFERASYNTTERNICPTHAQFHHMCVYSICSWPVAVT